MSYYRQFLIPDVVRSTQTDIRKLQRNQEEMVARLDALEKYVERVTGGDNDEEKLAKAAEAKGQAVAATNLSHWVDEFEFFWVHEFN